MVNGKSFAEIWEPILGLGYLVEPELPTVKSIHQINEGVSGMSIPLHVMKEWGGETWYKNDPLYCCKRLHINAGKHCSLHFHVRKHETLIVVSGILTIEAVVNKEICRYEVNPFEAFVVAPGFPHRLMALTGEVDLIEASTEHFNSDSVRLS